MRNVGKSCAFLTSNEKITLCGCRHVIKYSSSQVELDMCDTDISVCGSNLLLFTFENGEITVTGAIECIKFGEKTEGRL